MKSFIVPIIMWGYVLSAVLAKSMWAAFYGRIDAALDLSANQSWAFIVCMNLAVTALGLPQVVLFVASLRHGKAMPPSRHIGSALCIAATALCTAATTVSVFQLRQQLVAAAGELKPSSGTDLFTAGAGINRGYSTKNGAEVQ